jgi:hypothetical protein
MRTGLSAEIRISGDKTYTTGRPPPITTTNIPQLNYHYCHVIGNYGLSIVVGTGDGINPFRHFSDTDVTMLNFPLLHT